MDESARGERLTAFVSTVVAVAILAAGVTAHQKSVPDVTDVVQLASDLRFQFEMSFRHDTRERDVRLSRLDEVIAAWQKSTQNDEDREALSAWLREAGARSLPGTLRELPVTPPFSTLPPPVKQVVQKAPAGPQFVGPEKPASVARKPIAQKLETNTRPPLLAQGPAPAPVTPTPADPLVEQMIELRQPQSLDRQSLDFYTPTMSEAKVQPVAPRPVVAEKPKIVEGDLLASVPTRKSSQEVSVNVNLTELAARIAGYHDGLDEVELALLRMDSPDLRLIGEQVERLDAMTRDYGFVELYYESLTSAERESVIAPRSMKATIGEMGRLLNRYEEASDGDFLGSFDSATDEEIAALRARLVEIGKRVER